MSGKEGDQSQSVDRFFIGNQLQVDDVRKHVGQGHEIQVKVQSWEDMVRARRLVKSAEHLTRNAPDTRPTIIAVGDLSASPQAERAIAEFKDAKGILMSQQEWQEHLEKAQNQKQ